MVKKTVEQYTNWILIGLMGIVAFVMYKVITMNNLDLFEIPQPELSFGFMTAIIVAIIVWLYVNKKMKSFEVDSKVKLVVGIVAAIISFVAIYQYLITGIIAVIIVIAILVVLFFTGGLSAIFSGIYALSPKNKK